MSLRPFFDTATLRTDHLAELLARAAADVNDLRHIGKHRIGIPLDGTADTDVMAHLVWALGAALPVEGAPPFPTRSTTRPTTSPPVFHMNRAEPGMLRYMRRLVDGDLAPGRAMISFGPCTMKLNTAAQAMPLTWPGFADLQPSAPPDQAQGYREALEDLSVKLCAIAGFDAFSMQPDSGAQGEDAGPPAIRRLHLAHGNAQRPVCLIPVSAHGTDPAWMEGMEVVVVNTRPQGDVDRGDLRAKAEATGRPLAATITCPQVGGVLEDALREVRAVAQDHGGQVYLDRPTRAPS